MQNGAIFGKALNLFNVKKLPLFSGILAVVWHSSNGDTMGPAQGLVKALG